MTKVWGRSIGERVGIERWGQKVKTLKCLDWEDFIVFLAIEHHRSLLKGAGCDQICVLGEQSV